MKILGIDYGKSKIGLALAEGAISEPWMVIRFRDKKNLLAELKVIAEKEKVEKIVVGVSEGDMGKESENFSRVLGQFLSLPVDTFDETLTSKDAQRLSQEAGIRQKKRREMEDAYAASVMLQNYLDSNP
ncbi:MAG TPA: Holliday junction resolvase RuvX [Patescibacteria group bacterium]|nr:Holliday junction resolvase RuvX [Patescibacteria group bacterium]